MRAVPLTRDRLSINPQSRIRNRAMILRPPFIPSVLPEIHAYHTFIKASGSSIKMETLHALDRFVRDCYNAGIWSSLIEVYPFCGDNLAGAMSKLKNYAIAPACTAVNF